MSDISVTVTNPGVIDATVSAGGQVAAIVSSGGAVSVQLGDRLAWDEITGKPLTFPPQSHTHQAADISDRDTALVTSVNGQTGAVTVSGGSGASTWEEITGKPTTFPPDNHSHLAADISDRATSLVTSVNGLTGDVIISGGSGMAWSSVPASATAAGTAGDLAYDADYLYLAIADNTWRRVTLESWLPDSSVFSITAHPQNTTVSLTGGSGLTISAPTFVDPVAKVGPLDGEWVYASVSAIYSAGSNGQPELIDQFPAASFTVNTPQQYLPVTVRPSVGTHYQARFISRQFAVTGEGLLNGVPKDQSCPNVLPENTHAERVLVVHQTPYAPTIEKIARGAGDNGGAYLGDTTEYGTYLAYFQDYAVEGSYEYGAMSIAESSAGVTVIGIRPTYLGIYYGYGNPCPTVTLDENLWSGNASQIPGTSKPFVRIAADGSTLITTFNDQGEEGLYWHAGEGIWDGSKFVFLLMQVGAGGMQLGVYAATSADGFAWSKHALPIDTTPYSIAYGNGKYIAVGPYYGQATNDLAYSTDGTTWYWASNALPAVAMWRAVRFGAGVFIAVGTMSGVGVTAWSTDGQTWTMWEGAETIQPTPGLSQVWSSTSTTTNANWGTVTYGADGTGTATFSVTVSNGAGATISYQWQTRASSSGTWADVDNATTATLSVTGLTSSDNGRQYRVRISRTGGSDQAPGITDTYYSDTATLTVS